MLNSRTPLRTAGDWYPFHAIRSRLARCGCSTNTGRLRHDFPESQWDSITQPRVARNELPWVNRPKFINPEWVESNPSFVHPAVMPQSLAKILVHTVFSTKARRPFLRDQALREELHRYLGGILAHLDCQPITAGGVEDHVHLL